MNEKKLTSLRFPALRAFLLGSGAAAGLFTLAVCAIMLQARTQLIVEDPLNHVELNDLRDSYAEDIENAELREQIRELDLHVRHEYFHLLDKIERGGRLAISGSVVMITLLLLALALTPWLPPLPPAGCEGMFWIGVSRARLWLAGAGIIILAVTIMLIATNPSEITPVLLEQLNQAESLQ